MDNVEGSEGGKRGDFNYRSGSRLRGCVAINISGGFPTFSARANATSPEGVSRHSERNKIGDCFASPQGGTEPILTNAALRLKGRELRIAGINFVARTLTPRRATLTCMDTVSRCWPEDFRVASPSFGRHFCWRLL